MEGEPEAVTDLAGIETLTELAHAFKQLRGARTQASLTKAAAALPTRDGHRPALPKSTVSDLLTGKSVPSRDTVVTFLTVCGLIDSGDQAPWLRAWQRVATAHLRRPAGAVRIQDARARLLGVHAAIQLDGDQRGRHTNSEADDHELPAYVPRDLDADLRTRLTVACQHGGFVLLTGDSSVGKTRALFQALREVMPEWWLVHPADATAVNEFAAAPTDRTVVWLDELQNYLDHPNSLSAATIRTLVSAGVVVVATLWPGEYDTRTTPRILGQPDRYANDRQLLGLAEIVPVPATFSLSERRRAEDLACNDRRVRVALETLDAGFTQVMAAGPQLIRHWENAPITQCYGKAVITAALDARRIGGRAPVTRAYLKAAAPEYLTSAQQATASVDWLDMAMDYATRPLDGAAAALAPVPAGMGQIAGYEVADYLHQHGLRVRRISPLPDSAWQALVDHHHADDTLAIADSARRRGRRREAEILYRRGLEGGDLEAPIRVADLMVNDGRVDDAITVLREYMDTTTAVRLAKLLAGQGLVDDAIAVLRKYADQDSTAAVCLAGLLAKHGSREQAINLLREVADGDLAAAKRLANLLADKGRFDEAIALLRPHADTDPLAADHLASLLNRQGRVDELAQRASDGDPDAARWLAYSLAEQGRPDEAIELLRPHADTDPWVAKQVAELLIQQGHVDDGIELLRRFADYDPLVAAALASQLTEHGHVDELTRRAYGSDAVAAIVLSETLVQQGRVDEAVVLLRGHVVAGSRIPGRWLANLLARQSRFNELADEVAAGTFGAAEALRRATST